MRTFNLERNRNSDHARQPARDRHDGRAPLSRVNKVWRAAEQVWSALHRDHGVARRELRCRRLGDNAGRHARRAELCHLDLRVKRSYPFGFMGVDLIDAVGAISATVASHGHQMKASLTLFILSLLIGANGAHAQQPRQHRRCTMTKQGPSLIEAN